MNSIALFDPARVVGEWREVASFREVGPCQLCELRFSGDRQALPVSTRAGTGELSPTGPGRLATSGLGGPVAEPWWVLWVDTDYRTLVLGTPSGSFGVVLDRGEIGADRLKVAREILDWAGYDLRRLRPATP